MKHICYKKLTELAGVYYNAQTIMVPSCIFYGISKEKDVTS